VIGADGAFSAVRGRMQRLDRFDYSQSYLGHGYKELTIPPAPGGGFSLEKNALHIWPRGGFMMIALPNFDGSFTCTLFWPFEGPNRFDALQTKEDVLRHFERVFPDAVPLIPTLAEDYFESPTSALVTVPCRPWHYRDRVALVGDASHAVVPGCARTTSTFSPTWRSPTSWRCAITSPRGSS
jgi:kynurenine 3-monooxygenase